MPPIQSLALGFTGRGNARDGLGREYYQFTGKAKGKGGH